MRLVLQVFSTGRRHGVATLLVVLALGLLSAPAAYAGYTSSATWTGFQNPSAVAILSSGDVLVADWSASDSSQGLIDLEDTQGTQLKQWTQLGSGQAARAFGDISALAVAPATGQQLEHVWVAESGSSGGTTALDELNTDGSMVASLSGPVSGQSFSDLTSLVAAPDGSIWVADAGDYAVYHLAPDGTELAEIGGACQQQPGQGAFTDGNGCQGGAPNQSDAILLARDATSGDLLAVQDGVLQRFDSDGNFLDEGTGGGECYSSGGCPAPCNRFVSSGAIGGLVFDPAGELLVAQAPAPPTTGYSADELDVLGLDASTSGTFLPYPRDEYGPASDLPYATPTGVALSGDSHTIYITDNQSDGSGQGQVEVLSYTGSNLGDECKPQIDNSGSQTGGGTQTGSGTQTGGGTQTGSGGTQTGSGGTQTGSGGTQTGSGAQQSTTGNGQSGGEGSNQSAQSVPPIPQLPPGPRAALGGKRTTKKKLSKGIVQLAITLGAPASFALTGELQLVWQQALPVRHGIRRRSITVITVNVTPLQKQLAAGTTTLQLVTDTSNAARLARAIKHHAAVRLLYDAIATGAGGGETDLSGELSEGNL